MKLASRGAMLLTLGMCAFLCELPEASAGGLVWSTFLRGDGLDYGQDIAVDSAGNVWVSGATQSEDFPTTSGAYDSTIDSRDIFVAQLDPTGSDLVYATVLGGIDWEEGYSLALDGAGNVYLAGYTESEDFPVTSGALDTALADTSDAFVVKLAAAGGGMVYSTLLGGSEADNGYRIAVDDHGRACVVGVTRSEDFPVTPGAFDETHNGGLDAFIARLDSSGRALDFATFLGGGQADYGWDVAVDDSGNVFVAGYTYSNNFPTTPGAFDSTLIGPSDVFVAKLETSGGALRYATLLGGGDRDAARSLVIDAAGNAYVTGYTASHDFPTTAGAFDSTSGIADTDAFVTKLDHRGAALVFSTFLGGKRTDSGYGIAVDESAAVWVTGFTEADDFPTTSGAFGESHNGERDIFLAVLNAMGSRLDYGTFLGGAEDDYGRDLALCRDGDVCLVGYTFSVDFPTTAGAFEEIYGADVDAFALKLNPHGPVPVERESPPVAVPRGCALYQNHPNPFNAETVILYRLSISSRATLKVYNSLGQVVRTLESGRQVPGEHRVIWDGWDDGGRPVASGPYFCQLEAGGVRRTIKMLLVR